tara:strand:+ start:954 stop:1181 length:228 start_codon:yes stop_codon:yes gene_type:complete
LYILISDRRQNMPHDEKVMVACSTSLIERCDALKDFIARQNLRGRANRSDVIRTALSRGLDELEEEAGIISIESH